MKIHNLTYEALNYEAYSLMKTLAAPHVMGAENEDEYMAEIARDNAADIIFIETVKSFNRATTAFNICFDVWDTQSDDTDELQSAALHNFIAFQQQYLAKALYQVGEIFKVDHTRVSFEPYNKCARELMEDLIDE